MLRNASAENQRRFKTLMDEFQLAAAENLDEDEKRLILRIADSAEGSAIFAKIEDDTTAKRILSLCVEAHFLLRNFNRLVADARTTLENAPVRRQAIETVELLLRDTQAPGLNRLTAYTVPDRERFALECHAVESIKDRLAVQIRTAEETLLRLGTTRKNQGKKAAGTAAIGWIAEGVKRITKTTNARLSADLAQLILQCDVSLDQVDNAVETRKRDWRLHGNKPLKD